MYTSHFGLTEKPFAITPDPRYLYLSERHAEALAHLSYGIREAGGFIQLTGEVGTGKTTVLRSLLQRLPPNCDIALILNPRVTPAEFLQAICDELHVPVPEQARGSVKELVDLLNRVLLEAHARGRRVVVMVDEAQNLSPDVLEQVRLLTNLETATQKLLQIILIGQPELRDALARTDLRQLAQRITGRYHLEALSRSETTAYVQHRLRVAGSVAEVFTPSALAEIHRLSGGIPRIINVLCDRALLGAYTREERRVGPDLVRSAASEVYGRAVMPRFARWAAIAGALAGLGLLGVALWQSWPSTPEPAPSVAAPAPAAAAPAPPAAPAPMPSVASLLAVHADETTTDAAFSKLFRLWRAPYAPGAARPCDQAVDQGLQCVAQRGTFAQLRLINRPAILSLVDASGAERQVVVSAIEGDRARIELGDASREVSFADLAGSWFGEFLVVWRPPVPMAKELRPGMRGDDVRWLRRGLEKVNGLPGREGGDDVFDGELTRLVQDFQRTHRLAVDGIAGAQTQVVLDSALGVPGTPRLTTVGAGGGV